MTRNGRKRKKVKQKLNQVKNVDRYDLGDLFLHYNSSKHEEVRYKQNPYIEVGSNTLISSGVVVGETDLGGNLRPDGTIKIKSYDDIVKIGDNCVIQSGSILKKGCIIGNNVVIKSHCIIHRGANIGDNCIIEEKSVVRHDAVIQPNSHYYSRHSLDNEKKRGGVSYENNSRKK